MFAESTRKFSHNLLSKYHKKYHKQCGHPDQSALVVVVHLHGVLFPLRDVGNFNFEIFKSFGEEVFIHHLWGISIYGGSDNGNQIRVAIQFKANILVYLFFLKKSNFYVHIPRKYIFHFSIISFQKLYCKQQSQKLRLHFLEYFIIYFVFL